MVVRLGTRSLASGSSRRGYTKKVCLPNWSFDRMANPFLPFEFPRFLALGIWTRKDRRGAAKSISQGLHGSIILLNSRFVAIVRGGLLVAGDKKKERNFLFRSQMARAELIIATT